MNKKQPDAVATILGHALVGLGIGLIAKKATKDIGAGIVFAVIGLFIHAALDAPVSQKLSEAGI